MSNREVPYLELNLSSKVLSSNVLRFLHVIQNCQSLKKFYQPVEEDELRMVIQILHKEFDPHSTQVEEELLKKFSETEKATQTAFSYINYFFVDIEGAFFTQNGNISLKLKLRDETIFNILSRLRIEAIQRHDLVYRDAVVFQVVLAVNIKPIPSNERDSVKRDMCILNYYCSLNPEIKLEQLSLFTLKKKSLKKFSQNKTEFF